MPGDGVVVGYDAGGTPRRVLVDTAGRIQTVVISAAPTTSPSTFNHGSRTTTIGVRVPLHAGLTVLEVMVTARPANTGFVYIGGAAVSAVSYGKRLSAGDFVIIAIDNLNKVYMDVSVDNEGVDYLYVAA